MSRIQLACDACGAPSGHHGTLGLDLLELLGVNG